MVQGLQGKKRRNIRRIIVASLLIIAVAAVVVLTRERTPVPSVRTSVLETGDISRNYYVTANIRAGAVTEHIAAVRQKVTEVKVSLHQQVSAGDVLLVLDQEELKKEYDNAVAARKAIENEAAEEKRLAEQKEKELSDQISALSYSLSAAVDQLTVLTEEQPAEIQIDPELGTKLEEIISGLQPDAPQEGLSEIIDTLTASVSLIQNEEYSNTTKEIADQLQAANKALAALLDKLVSGGLGDMLFSSSDITEQLGGLSALGLTVQSPLDQAKAREAAAKTALDASEPYLYAKTPGLISAVNVKAGDYTGTAAIGTGAGTGASAGIGGLGDLSGLEALLGGAISGTSASEKSLVTIYDNTIPEAVFLAGRFDSGRIETGMPVKFVYEDLSFTGEVIWEGKIAVSGGMEQLQGLEMFSSATGADISGEPQVEIVMSIEGEGLTDLVPGFTIEAQIETANAKDVVLLPAESMRRELEKYYVFVLNNDGTVSRKDFEPGIQSELYVEVISGLAAGDEVILSPSAELTEGMKVRVSNDG